MRFLIVFLSTIQIMNKKFGPFIKVGGVPVIGCEISSRYFDKNFKVKVSAEKDNLPNRFYIHVENLAPNSRVDLFGDSNYYQCQGEKLIYKFNEDRSAFDIITVFEYKLNNDTEVAIFEYNEKS